MENKFTPMEIANMSNEELEMINNEQKFTEMELEFSDEEYNNILEAAKIKNMTFNEYIIFAVERALNRYIEIEQEINGNIEVLEHE